jgi:hypothetical protein
MVLIILQNSSATVAVVHDLDYAALLAQTVRSALDTFDICLFGFHRTYRKSRVWRLQMFSR